jgi:tRNA threonylcarbamoyladenosine biosynthesis protein TsaE
VTRLQFQSGSEEQTSHIAGGIAKLLRPGDVVMLKGQLGAGKTFFIRAAARALGVERPVTSPSFTMAQSYPGTPPIHHLDLYRLPAFDVQAESDFSMFFEPDAITFVEWPEVAEGYIKAPALVITIQHKDEHTRRFEIDCNSEEMEHGLEILIADISD